MAIFKFSITLKKGDKVEKEDVSIESIDGTISNKEFFSALPNEFKDWEIVDISKK